MAQRLLLFRHSRPLLRSHILAPMGRRSRSSIPVPTLPAPEPIQPNVGASLVKALDSIPPAPLNHVSEDDLTPPPALPDVTTHINLSNGHAEVPPEAVENGVNGTSEIELPPQKRAKRKLKVTETIEKDSGAVNDAAAEPTAETPKRKRSTKKANEDRPPLDAVATEPKNRGKRKSANPVKEEEEEQEQIEEKKPKRRGKAKDTSAGETDGEEKPKRKTPKKSRMAKDEPEYDSEGNEIVKKKRKPKVYPKIEYDIPPVEKKESSFKGRLGYACLNTVLRKTKPDSIFCSRTCRIASIEEEGMELPKTLALLNVKDLKIMIEWNEQNNIRFLRLSSEMFPFASHDKYGYDLSFAAAELKEAGDLAKKYGHRLTMHPGQFTQLGSPKPGVIKASVRELDYQCEILDRMGIDQDGVMIIHMGGVYGDKPGTLERFKENYINRLSDRVKARLVLENDELCYNVDDLLPICEELNIPLVFDYHHDWIFPSQEPPEVLIPKINELWHKKGIRVKQHLSEPRPGAETVMEKRAHADRCKALPPALPQDIDLMIEAKDKEQAVFELYRIYSLEDVIHDNLRPPNPNPSLHTGGRKSSGKKKTKETGEVDSDGNSIVLSDVDKEGDVDLADGMVDGDEEKPHDVKAEVEGGVVQEKPKKGRRKSRKAEASAQPNGESDAYVADAEEAAAPTQKARGRGKKSL